MCGVAIKPFARKLAELLHRIRRRQTRTRQAVPQL
jgi:hypothetical protein